MHVQHRINFVHSEIDVDIDVGFDADINMSVIIMDINASIICGNVVNILWIA